MSFHNHPYRVSVIVLPNYATLIFRVAFPFSGFIEVFSPVQDTLFWQGLEEVVHQHRLVIERPRGSPHQRCADFLYPLDYGDREGTQAMDQRGIDVWVGILTERRISVLICPVDLTKTDAEIKTLFDCTPAEAEIILRIHNRAEQSAMRITCPDTWEQTTR